MARRTPSSPPRPRSPFRASFGTNPPYLAGRAAAIETVQAGLESGIWPQERAILLTGLRGVGKTVLLNEVEDIARVKGWEALHITAREGVVDELAQTILPQLANRLQNAPTMIPDSGGIAGANLHLTRNPAIRDVVPSLRSGLEQVVDLLDEQHTGFFITVDEVHGDASADLAALCTEFQHLARDGREVGIVFAGVPENVDKLKHNKGLTFIRRALPVEIGLIDYEEVKTAFAKPIADNGRLASDEVIDYMARAAQGYPFLIQLIGDLAWRAHPERDEITLDDARSAFGAARRRMGANVYEPSLSDLSDVDRSFLVAMSLDDEPSKPRDIAQRMNVERKYVDVYRDRLIKARIIKPAGYGLIDFTLPYLRQYLRETQAAEAMGGAPTNDYPAPPPLE